MANYIQYIPQVNSTTYPVSINDAFTALTADVTALEDDKVDLINATEQIIESDIKIKDYDLVLQNDGILFDWIRPNAGVNSEAKIRVYDDVTLDSSFGWNYSTNNWFFDNSLTLSTGNLLLTSGDLTLSSGNFNVTGNIVVSGTVDGREALADVTDVTNVTAAGALMDSEVDTNIKTLTIPASTTISTFGASLVDDTSAAIARTTLGISNSKVYNYIALGSANALTVNIPDGLPSSLSEGTFLICRCAYANTSTAVTLNLNSTGVNTVRLWDASFPRIGAIQGDDAIHIFQWDSLGNFWILVNPFAGGTQYSVPKSTVSGSAQTYTDVPTGCTRVTLMLNEVSLSTTANPFIRIGDSGGLESGGYTNGVKDGVGTVNISATSYFQIGINVAADDLLSGVIHIELMDPATNLWVASGNINQSTFLGTIAAYTFSGSKTLSSIMTQVSLQVTTGTFDAGTINVKYEF